MDFALLKKLTETPGVPGRENLIREILTAELTPHGAEIRTDRMGNLIAHLPGKGPKVALAAHMDEVGFMVSKIEEEGFIRVVPLGGIDRRVFWAQRVMVHGRKDLPGVVGSIPPHLFKAGGMGADKAVPLEDCFIDLGLRPGQVAESVRVGDPVTFDVASWENEESFFGKAIDDRAGLFVMLRALAQAEKIDCDLYLIGSVQEEYGLRGAGPAVFSVDPDIFLALEGTFALDMPGLSLPANMAPTAQGRGPEIRLNDKGMISHRGLVDFLAGLAGEKGIPHQLAVKEFGRTDAAVGQVTGPGTAVCAVSAPVRYIHAPMGLANKADLENMVELIAVFLENASGFAA